MPVAAVGSGVIAGPYVVVRDFAVTPGVRRRPLDHQPVLRGLPPLPTPPAAMRSAQALHIMTRSISGSLTACEEKDPPNLVKQTIYQYIPPQ